MFELRQVAENFWEWHMVRTQDPLRSIVGAKELPGLAVIYSRYTSSLHLSQYPEALVQSHVLPWSRRVPFLGRE